MECGRPCVGGLCGGAEERSGGVEAQSHSKVDGAITPFTLYLHGTGGTQWELERTMRYYKKPLAALDLVTLSPCYRGNPEFNDTIIAFSQRAQSEDGAVQGRPQDSR